MNIDKIEVNTQSSIRLNLDKIIYFDPYKIEDSNNDNQFLLDNDIINNDTDKTDKNNSGEKTGEKHK